MTMCRLKQLLILSFAVASIVSILLACSPRSIIEERGSVVDSGIESQDTVVAEEWFQITLPGRWKLLPGSGETRFTYSRDAASEQLTVSLFFSDHKMGREEQQVVLERMIELSRQAELNVVGSSLELTQTGYGEQGDTIVARYGGYKAPNRRSVTLLMCAPHMVAKFYYEAFDLAETTFESRGRSIMNSIVLAKPKGN
jgi:hypothetical protein